jgi:hypothetical protein
MAGRGRHDGRALWSATAILITVMALAVPQRAHADTVPVDPNALAQAGLAQAQHVVDLVTAAASAARAPAAVPVVTHAPSVAVGTASAPAAASSPAAAPQPAARPAAAITGATSRVMRPPAPPVHSARVADPPLPVAASAARAGAHPVPPAPARRRDARRAGADRPVRAGADGPGRDGPDAAHAGRPRAGARRRSHGADAGHLHPVGAGVGVRGRAGPAGLVSAGACAGACAGARGPRLDGVVAGPDARARGPDSRAPPGRAGSSDGSCPLRKSTGWRRTGSHVVRRGRPDIGAGSRAGPSLAAPIPPGCPGAATRAPRARARRRRCAAELTDDRRGARGGGCRRRWRCRGGRAAGELGAPFDLPVVDPCVAGAVGVAVHAALPAARTPGVALAVWSHAGRLGDPSRRRAVRRTP